MDVKYNNCEVNVVPPAARSYIDGAPTFVDFRESPRIIEVTVMTS
jgi:hypothetical protein